MPTTDELIRRLSADVGPLPRGAASRRLAAAIALGTVVSFIAIVLWLGPPLQSVQHTGAAAFTMKLLFSMALFVGSFVLLLAAGRPGHQLGLRWLWLGVPLLLVAFSAVLELSLAPSQSRTELWLGSTWQICLLAIVLLSLPVFAGVVWSFQRLAPTRLRLAGLLAGLTAGSAAASVYALYCPETTATFLLSWYPLGIIVAGLIGALIGPRLLRW